MDTSPPGRLRYDSELPVDVFSPLSSLTQKLPVFIGGGKAVGALNSENEEGGEIAANVNGDNISGSIQGRDVEIKRTQSLEGYYDEGEREYKRESERHRAEEVESLCKQSRTTRFVVKNGVEEGNDNGNPADQEAKGGNPESCVCRRRLRPNEGLLRRALQLDTGPRARNNEEEVQPPPQVEPQGDVKLKLGSGIIILQCVDVGVADLPLRPASPVTNGFPHQGDDSHLHQVPEKDGQDDGDLHDVVALDINVGEETDESKGADHRAPIPLPPAADWEITLFLGQKEAAVLAKVDDDEDETEREEGSEGNASLAAGADGVERSVARSRIHKTSIGVDVGSGIRLESEVALGSVGQSLILEKMILELPESIEVEVTAADLGVGVIVTGREGDCAPDVQVRHGDDDGGGDVDRSELLSIDQK